MRQFMLSVVAVGLLPAVVSAQTPSTPGGSDWSVSAPAMAVNLDMGYYRDSGAGSWSEALGELPGFRFSHAGHADEHGHGLSDGFQLFHGEVMLSATVDPYLDGVLTLGVDEEGTRVEEAYGRTRALPAGLQLQAGRFSSAIGYQNSQHSHQWDFADMALPYVALFGEHGLREKGLQLSWVPATRHYTRLGMELLQGENELLASTDSGAFELAEKSGPRMLTAFAKWAPDLGTDHAMQLGLFGGYSRQHRVLDEHADDAVLYQGKPWFAGVDWVYKFDPGAYHGHRSLTLQGEYLYRVYERDVVAADDPAELGEELKDTQDGLYLQAVYGIAPRWRAGLRYEVLGLVNQHTHDGMSEDGERSERITANLTWQPSEFSLLRLQLAQGRLALEDGKETYRQLYLQYQLALGAHGAHRF